MKKEIRSYDVAVIGGGPGGLPAALEAARHGASVLLVEKNGYLGGNLTIGLPLLGFLDKDGTPIIRGIAQELVDDLARRGAASPHTWCPLHNSVTIYAGYTLEDIDRMLWSRGFAGRGAFLSACDELASEYGMSFVEGYLMSGVYEFTDVHSLAYSMLSSTLDWFRSHSQELASSSLSMDDAVRIASMVNRETQDEEQMPFIAAVILNRLEADMPLGIDATTRYELEICPRAHMRR